MRVPRVTTRRWMLTAAIFAVLAAFLLQVQAWFWLRTRYDCALRVYAASTQRYKDGRLNPVDLVWASLRLMEAELDLSASEGQKIVAITAHLGRTSRVIDEEREQPRQMHDRLWLVALEIDQALADSKSKLDPCLHTPGVKEALGQCTVKLNELKLMK